MCVCVCMRRVGLPWLDFAPSSLKRLTGIHMAGLDDFGRSRLKRLTGSHRAGLDDLRRSSLTSSAWM